MKIKSSQCKSSFFSVFDGVKIVPFLASEAKIATKAFGGLLNSSQIRLQKYLIC